MKKLARLALGLFCLLAIAGAVLAQSLADTVVGYWVMSSGTPVTLAYGENEQKLIMRIDEGADIEVWLNASRDGDTVLTFEGPGGATITGVYNSGSETIELYEGDQALDTWVRSDG